MAAQPRASHLNLRETLFPPRHDARSALGSRATWALQFTARLPQTFGAQPVFGGVSRDARSTPTELATDIWSEWSLSTLIRRMGYQPERWRAIRAFFATSVDGEWRRFTVALSAGIGWRVSACRPRHACGADNWTLSSNPVRYAAGLMYAAGDVGLSLVYELHSTRAPSRQTLRFGVEF